MKELTVNNRVGGSGVRDSANRTTAQRPVRRERAGKNNAKPESRFTFKRIAPWLPLIGKVFVVVCIAVLLVVGYRMIAAASFFRAAEIDVTGAERVSADHLAATVKRKAATANVWQLDLDELSKELEKEPWVRSALVSRVLPSGLRVRITERVPVAVVRTGAGQLMWTDADAVLLARVAPTDELPPFFLRGFDETLTTAAQTENRRRINEAVKMTDEWRKAGIVDRISEVSVEDLRDVRAQLSGRDSAIEVRLGASNYGARLEKALRVLDEERDAPGGRRGARVVRLDATTEKRVILGLDNSARTEQPASPTTGDAVARQASSSAPASRSSTAAAATRQAARPVVNETKTKPREERKPAATTSVAGRRVEEKRARERTARENDRREAKKQAALTSRPRRVS